MKKCSIQWPVEFQFNLFSMSSIHSFTVCHYGQRGKCFMKKIQKNSDMFCEILYAEMHVAFGKVWHDVCVMRICPNNIFHHVPHQGVKRTWFCHMNLWCGKKVSCHLFQCVINAPHSHISATEESFQCLWFFAVCDQ